MSLIEKTKLWGRIQKSTVTSKRIYKIGGATLSRKKKDKDAKES